MTQILALIDGSIYGASICDLIKWAAEKTNASVTLLHVIDINENKPLIIDLSGSIGLGTRTALLEELAQLDEQKAKLAKKQGCIILDDAKMRLEQNGLHNIKTFLRHETLTQALNNLEHEADIVVLGKRGQEADFEKMNLGDNFENLVRTTHKPILVASRTIRPIQNVLVAYDASETMHHALDYMAQSPLFDNLAIHLLMVKDEDDQSRAKLNDGVLKLGKRTNKVTSQICSGATEQIISETVKAGSYDLLVMGAYSHSNLKRFFVGSTTTQMIKNCHIPIMLFKK